MIRFLCPAVIFFSFITLSFGQDRIISGKVTDENSSPLPGVNVFVKGTSSGTITDADGKYVIDIGTIKDAVLVFSSVGFGTQEFPVGAQSVIDVQLSSSQTVLSEVVVTGYSTLQRKDISSSIAVVDVKDMNKFAAPNFADQLEGKIPGVQVSTSGDPGSFQYVRVRGIGSVNNNEPLYVIDGVPVENETNMNFLNPGDIESFQVLKDAAAASIYGARAANGVIVITTKQGRGKSKLNIHFYSGIQLLGNYPEMANPTELMKIEQGEYEGAEMPFESQFYIKDSEGKWQLPDYIVKGKGYVEGDANVLPSKYILNTKDPSQFPDNFPITKANKNGTDWFKELYKPATIINAQVSSSSGNENGSHYFSLNYYDYKGTLIKNEYQRILTRINSSFSPRKNLKMGENLNIAFQNNIGSYYFLTTLTGVPSPYNFSPIIPLYDINGYWAASGINENPVALQTRMADGQENLNLRLTGNIFAEFDFLKYFRLKSDFGLDYGTETTESYNYLCPECCVTDINYLDKYYNNNRNWVVSGTIDFTRSVGQHNFYALGGVELRNAYYEGFNAGGAGLDFGDDPYYRELGNTQSGSYEIGSQTTNNRLASLFFSLNYNFKDKYIISGIIREDGSSRFINHKYGTFPGISAAWRISNEPFFRNLRFINDLKLRASYGLTGNNEVIGGDYPGYTIYGTSLGGTSYDIHGTTNSVVQGYAQLAPGNPDLKWETCKLTNLAFDLTTLRNLDLTIEWYNRKTENMIYGVSLPWETGTVGELNTNVGSMINKGIDIQLNYKGRSSSGKFNYSIAISGTYYSNKVLKLNNDSTASIWGITERTITEVGHPISQLYGFIAEGLWQSQEEIDSILYNNTGEAKIGRMKFRDVNMDGKITNDDRTIIGNPLPKFILGFNLNFNYNNFDFNAYFNGVLGNKIFNINKKEFENKSRLYEAGKTWPVLDINDNVSFLPSSFYVEDGSFLRMRNMVFGYTFPKKGNLNNTGGKIRIYLQGGNLFTLTHYSGLDPDVTLIDPRSPGNLQRKDIEIGMDAGRYPVSKQIIIGFNAEF